MARIQAWTDEWVRSLPHPASGEIVIHDPQISGHRLVVSKTRKICEVQRDRPLRFGPRKTFKVQTGDLLTATIEDSRTKAIAVLGQIANGFSPHLKKEPPKATTLGSAWHEFKNRGDLRPSYPRAISGHIRTGFKKMGERAAGHTSRKPCHGA